MSASVTPSLFQGEHVLEMPEAAPVMDLSRVYAQAAPAKENYEQAFDPNFNQKSPATTMEQVYASAPILQEVPVIVETTTLDFKQALLFLGLGFLTYKFIFKKMR